MPNLPLTPHYELPAPLIIGARLTPAVAIADGYISVEATGVEDSDRAHFRFIIEAPLIDTYVSESSDVTVLGRDWTHAAMLALETVCDAIADSVGDVPEWVPADIADWLRNGAYFDCSTVAEEIRDAIEQIR